MNSNDIHNRPAGQCSNNRTCPQNSIIQFNHDEIFKQFKALSYLEAKEKLQIMGRGDIKTKRGKIANKSYGARRKRKIKKRIAVEDKIAIEKVKKA